MRIDRRRAFNLLGRFTVGFIVVSLGGTCEEDDDGQHCRDEGKLHINLGPSLSVPAIVNARIGNRIQKIYFALIGSEHEVSRVWIIWILLGGSACGSNRTINNCKISLIFGLKSGPHIFLVLSDR